MNRIFNGATRVLAAMFLLAAVPALSANAHDLPYSYIELRTEETGITARIEITDIDAAHELGTVTPEQLLNQDDVNRCSVPLANLLLRRLSIVADGKELPGKFCFPATPVPVKQNVALTFQYAGSARPKTLEVNGQLFPYDPRHKSFLSVYAGGRLMAQKVLQPGAYRQSVSMQRVQSIPSVVRQFVAEGVHHIYLGPDHILFIFGLVLLPATINRLLKIVTAFTVAHSITLAAATFGILNPPARLVEPTIALSIVIVGIHALIKERRDKATFISASDPEAARAYSALAGARPHKLSWLSDPRMLFAFGFGLIHGFGFASALREMELPRYALGWSLLSFNVGVEMGQACIVLAAAPFLAALRARKPIRAYQVVIAGSVLVIVAGAFWFVQRVAA